MKTRPSLLATILLTTVALQAQAQVQAISKKPAHPHQSKQPGKTAAMAQRSAPAPATAKSPGPLYQSRADVMQQARELAARRSLDAQWVQQAIGQARYMPDIAKAILPPLGVAKNWNAYRSRFVEPRRIAAGTRFWLDNRATLERAEQQMGVPASLIVGILGVETIYGQNTGNYRVMDALSTLAFDFPAAHPKASARRDFFLSELEEYLVLTSRTHTDPLALRGSYAGALGWPQFMPSSWAKYAIDFDGDGRVDLFNSQADTIGSVANYFKAFHWQAGLPTHFVVNFDAATLDKASLLAADILPSFSVADMVAKGVLLAAPGDQYQGRLALVELQNGADTPQYLAGTENFYAITRYNWSAYYALAVIELGQAVAAVIADHEVAALPKSGGLKD